MTRNPIVILQNCYLQNPTTKLCPGNKFAITIQQQECGGKYCLRITILCLQVIYFCLSFVLFSFFLCYFMHYSQQQSSFQSIECQALNFGPQVEFEFHSSMRHIQTTIAHMLLVEKIQNLCSNSSKGCLLSKRFKLHLQIPFCSKFIVKTMTKCYFSAHFLSD